MISVMILNTVYAIVCTVIGITASFIAVKLFDSSTPFDTYRELNTDNRAVGIVVGCIYLGVLLAVAVIVGLSAN